MITANKGEIRLTGTEAELLTDYACIIRGLREALTKNHGEEETEKALQEAIRRSNMTTDELREEVHAEMCSIISEAVSEFLKNFKS